ncbi:MAG: cystathionine gamma-synthase [Acidimicrobiia bacterium]
MSGTSESGFNTRAIHAGQEPDHTGAVNVPVYFTSTYKQDGIGKMRFTDYGRVDNPTRHALEDCLAALEGGAHAVAYASGLAAEDALLRTLAPGDHVVLGTDVYGGTYRLITRVLGAWGVECTPIDLNDPAEVAREWRDTTRMVWVETPSNPMLTIFDIAALAEFAHARNALVVADNTFATPYLQNPLQLGADVVVHSATKYLGGHSDVIAGALVTNHDELAEQLRFHQFAIGAGLSPMDSYLLLRGIKTLGVRMDRHCQNAAAVVEWLQAQPEVDTVFYPGLASHDRHDLAARQMRGFSGMVSFIAAGGPPVAQHIVEHTELFTLGESLGGVESLIEVPAGMTHMSVAGSRLEVPPGLVRMSVGIEDVDDLIADLEAAFRSIS